MASSRTHEGREGGEKNKGTWLKRMNCRWISWNALVEEELSQSREKERMRSRKLPKRELENHISVAEESYFFFSDFVYLLNWIEWKDWLFEKWRLRNLPKWRTIFFFLVYLLWGRPRHPSMYQHRMEELYDYEWVSWNLSQTKFCNWKSEGRRSTSINCTWFCKFLFIYLSVLAKKSGPPIDSEKLRHRKKKWYSGEIKKYTARERSH